MNARFGGWSVRPSNIYFSVGQHDPNSVLSVFSQQNFSPKYKVTDQIPACGVSTSEDTVFGYILEGQFHADDLADYHANWPKAQTSRGLFYRALRQWLPCFNVNNQISTPTTGAGSPTQSPKISTAAKILNYHIQVFIVQILITLALGNNFTNT